MGRTYLEVAIQSEANRLVEDIGVRSANARGEPIDPSESIARIVNNVISQLVFGRNCSDEPHFERAVEYVTRMIEHSQPSERKLPRLLLGYVLVQFNICFLLYILLYRYLILAILTKHCST